MGTTLTRFVCERRFGVNRAGREAALISVRQDRGYSNPSRDLGESDPPSLHEWRVGRDVPAGPATIVTGGIR